ncbi:MAG TPA: phosphate propanoyltransferase [Clostridia bacterium]|nr:phosphate propanoyltransferase [Clostridia bacterium]
MNQQEIGEIIARVVGEIIARPQAGQALPAEVSARHVHLSAQDVAALFGTGHSLTPKRPLSQPGQFLCEERVDIVTPKGIFRNVAILGPVRERTQVEVSRSDAKVLGIEAPVRLSGNLDGAGCVHLVSAGGMITAPNSAIVAQNHIHMTPKDAMHYGVTDKELVQVKMSTARPLTFDNVLVRVSDSAALALHIDVDEANACAFADGDTALLLKNSSNASTAQTHTPAPPKAAVAVVPAPATQAQDKKPPLITEAVAKAMLSDGQKTVTLCKNAILTPMARDVFIAARVNIERK